MNTERKQQEIAGIHALIGASHAKRGRERPLFEEVHEDPAAPLEDRVLLKLTALADRVQALAALMTANAPADLQTMWRSWQRTWLDKAIAIRNGTTQLNGVQALEELRADGKTLDGWQSQYARVCGTMATGADGADSSHKSIGWGTILKWALFAGGVFSVGFLFRGIGEATGGSAKFVDTLRGPPVTPQPSPTPLTPLTPPVAAVVPVLPPLSPAPAQAADNRPTYYAPEQLRPRARPRAMFARPASGFLVTTPTGQQHRVHDAEEAAQLVASLEAPGWNRY